MANGHHATLNPAYESYDLNKIDIDLIMMYLLHLDVYKSLFIS